MPLRVKKFIYLIEVDFSSCLFHNLACHGHFYSEELVAFAVLSGPVLKKRINISRCLSSANRAREASTSDALTLLMEMITNNFQEICHNKSTASNEDCTPLLCVCLCSRKAFGDGGISITEQAVFRSY